MRPKQAIRPSYSVLDIEPYAKVAGRPMRPWEDALQEFAQAVEISGFE
jgi:dTDP-4-dehydrorhamnose reductase